MLGNLEELTNYPWLCWIEINPCIYPNQARFPCRKCTFIPLFITSVLSLLALLHATGLNGCAEHPVLCEGFVHGADQTPGTRVWFYRVPRLLQELAELKRARPKAGCLQIMCTSKSCSKMCCLSVAEVQSLIQQEWNQTSSTALLFLSRGQRFTLGGLSHSSWWNAWRHHPPPCMGNQKFEISVNSHPVHEAYGSAATDHLNENMEVFRTQCLLPALAVNSFCTLCGLSPLNFTKCLKCSSSVSAGAYYILSPSHRLRCLSTFIWAAARGDTTLPLL